MLHKTVKGHSIPALGLGTYRLTGPEGMRAILCGLETGYRHIDTAIRYGNETEVGAAIRQSGIPRSDLFVTTKIWFEDLAPERVAQRIGESLDRLQMDRVDLLLIHWPGTETPLAETLDAFTAAQARGQTRLIGVSNFTSGLLDRAAGHGADLFLNQVEYHPFLNQAPVLEAVARHDMLLTAYRPLAEGEVFGHPVLEEIAARHGKSAGQVALRWLLQQDRVLAIPRSSRPEHIRANFDIFDFELDPAQMAAISALRGDRRLCAPDWSPDWDPA